MLTPLLNPASVGIVGASQRAARGTRVVRNLLSVGFGGRIFPINPKYDEVLGLPCYPSIGATPESVDSLVVAIPARHVPGLLEDALAAGVRAAVILSSGFAEAGQQGRERQQALESLAARGMLICGPNCYGVFNVSSRAATFSGDIPDPLLAGNVALISQSGGFSNLIANPLMEGRGLGFSYIISCGNQAGVSIEDYIEYLVEDDRTEVIAVFVEGFRQPTRLREVAGRAARKGKPIVVLKVGRSAGAQQATLAHTGSLAGSADVLDAILKQSGIIRVRTLNELMETICLLASAGARTSGGRLGILTGSGGECGYVSDTAEEVGLRLPDLSASSLETLRDVLPDFATPRNPLDGTGAMYEDDAVFPRLIETLVADPDLDVVAVNLGAPVPKHGAWAPHRRFARLLAETAATTVRLLIAYSSTIGGALDPEVVGPLRAAGVPYLEGTEMALRAIANLNLHGQRLAEHRAARLRPEPGAAPRLTLPARSGALSFLEAQRLLADLGIPTVPTRLVTTPTEAVAAAEALGYPCVLKVESAQIAHKTDVGGVRLGCAGATAVRQAFLDILAGVERAVPRARIDGIIVQPMVSDGLETIVGVKYDPLFGPAVLFGLGGIFAEVLRDVSLRVPPITEPDAEAMLAEIRGRALLAGAGGRPPADGPALIRAILAVGALAQALGPRLVALDLNPLLVGSVGEGVLALDALVELA